MCFPSQKQLVCHKMAAKVAQIDLDRDHSTRKQRRFRRFRVCTLVTIEDDDDGERRDGRHWAVPQVPAFPAPERSVVAIT